MNFSLTSCNTPQSSGAWKVMKWDFFKEQMNERWRLSGPKVRWGHCQGPDFGVREGQGCSGVRRNTKGCWRLITYLYFIFQPRGSPLCKQMLRLWDCGCPEGLGQPQHGLCSSVVFWFCCFSYFLTHNLPLKLLMWGKVPRIHRGWGCLGCQMSFPALQSSLWRFPECSEPQVWDQTCWDLAAILRLSGTSGFFNMLLCNNPTKAAPN